MACWEEIERETVIEGGGTWGVGATGVEININLISTERRYTGIVLFAAISFALKLSPRVPATPSIRQTRAPIS